MDLSGQRLAAPASFPVARWALLAALLLAEVLGLTLRYDTASLAQTGAWWADLLGESHYVPQLAVVVALAALVFGGARLRDDYRALAATPARLPAWPFLLAHLASFLVFARLTGFLLEGDAASSAAPGAWFVAWVVLAALTLGTWGAVALPARLWLPLARRGLRPLLAALVIGVAALAVGSLAARLWEPLARSTFWAVRGLLRLAVRDPVCDPDGFVVGTRTFQVHVAPACSGYEGLGLVWVFVSAYLWWFRRELRWPHALALLPAATALMWGANAVRIAALVGLGTLVSPEVALGGFHSQAGWLAFNAVTLGAVAVARRCRFVARDVEPPPRAEGRAGAAPYLVPLLALVATLMVTGALSGGFDWGYPLRVVLVAAALGRYRRHYAAWRWSCSWPAAGIGVAVFVLWLALEPAGEGAAPSPFARGVPAGWVAAWLVFRVVGSVVTVPLAEELAFRGFLARRLIAADFEAVPPGRLTWVSFVVSSLLFGALHGRWVAGTLSGMAYAGAVYRRGEIAYAVWAHAVTNALIAAYVLTTGAWSLWA